MAQKRIRINYLDNAGNILASHDTGDEWNAEERRRWADWLSDRAVEHPGAPAGWRQYDLVPYTA